MTVAAIDITLASASTNNSWISCAWSTNSRNVRVCTSRDNSRPSSSLYTAISRRTLLQQQLGKSTAAISSFGVCTSFGSPVFGLSTTTTTTAPLDTGEAIRRAAANIPGYGQTDIFFPKELLGLWTMNRVVELPGRSEPIQLKYPFRFISSIEDDTVVQDRGSNQANLEEAIIRYQKDNNKLQQQQQQQKSDSISSTEGQIKSPVAMSVLKVEYEWKETNPNDLRLVIPIDIGSSSGSSGSNNNRNKQLRRKKEIKVTKRRVEKTDTTVSSSEFQRVTQQDDDDGGDDIDGGQRRLVVGGIPTVSARRVVSNYKIITDQNQSQQEQQEQPHTGSNSIHVEGIEIVYDMGGSDPLASTGGGAGGATVLSKSKIYLTR